MAIDEGLAEELRERLHDVQGVTEKKMFGGLAFLVDGNMCVGVMSTGDLMARVSPDEYDVLRYRPGAAAMEQGGRTMTGWMLVGPEGMGELDFWVETALAFVRTLPPK